jgi:hypothetical protein
MAGREGLPERLTARLAEMAEADLDALVGEARAEARAQVKAVLREAYAEALLEQAGAGSPGRAPAPAGAGRAEARREAVPAATADEDESGHGWWVYCVVPAERELPDGLAGVADDERPRLVPAGGVAALVSRVPLREFGEAPLRENLNDLDWLERTVRAHEAVLDSALAGGAVVPMRVCTIYRDEGQVRAMLESRGAELRDALARLAGKAEWGVKVVADRARLEDHARSQNDEAVGLADEVAGRPEGAAYLARKKLAALVRDEADRILDEVVRETHARLEEWAAASVVLPAQSRELAGYDGDMVFNGAYLVEDERVAAFSALVDELRAQYAPLGLSFDLTGPWPAYNFAGSDTAREVRA